MLATVVVVSIASAPSALAKSGLGFEQKTARVGEPVTLSIGRYSGQPFEPSRVYYVYFVPASKLGAVMYPNYGNGPRRSPPPRYAGAIKVGEVPTTRTSFRFSVPKVAPGRYAAALWCPRCKDPQMLGSISTGIPENAPLPSYGSLLTVRR